MILLNHQEKRGGNNKMTTALTIALISLVATLAVSIHEINR
ncbi:hypothetical protein [Enterococcus phage UTI-EfS7]|nr:hypothetical protein [Enterococcus phage UTI-EfS7]